MRKTKVNDMYAKGGWIRGDGSMIHDMYLMQVKTPAQSKEPWDYYNVVATIKGEAGVYDERPKALPIVEVSGWFKRHCGFALAEVIDRA
jgi:hypothetical protein